MYRSYQSTIFFGEPEGHHPGHGGVVEGAKDQGGLAFVGIDHRLLDLLVHRRFDGGDKARAHVDTVGAKSEGGSRFEGLDPDAKRPAQRMRVSLRETSQEREALNYPCC